MKMLKIVSLLTALLVILMFSGFIQDEEKVKVNLNKNQTERQLKSDKEQCLNHVEEEFDHTKHKTAKSGGAGVVVGGVAGKILGKPGAGAVVGGAAGTYRGYKKSKQDKQEFNEAYASCLIEKGYEVEVEN